MTIYRPHTQVLYQDALPLSSNWMRFQRLIVSTLFFRVDTRLLLRLFSVAFLIAKALRDWMAVLQVLHSWGPFCLSSL